MLLHSLSGLVFSNNGKKGKKKYIDAYLQKLLLVCFIFIDAPSGTRGGVEEYEAMEVDTDGGPGPQRCKYTTTSL